MSLHFSFVDLIMPRQLSTSLSDLILAISAFYVANQLYNHHLKPSIGLIIQGIAASVGIIRFSMENPEGSLIFKGHKFFSWLAATFGVPTIALGFCGIYGSAVLANKIIIFVGIVAVSSFFLPTNMRQLTTQAVSGFAMLTILLLCFMNRNWYGLGAAVLYVVSGLIGGSDGQIGPFYKVDILHYGLVIGNLMFWYSFPTVDPPPNSNTKHYLQNF